MHELYTPDFFRLFLEAARGLAQKYPLQTGLIATVVAAPLAFAAGRSIYLDSQYRAHKRAEQHRFPDDE
jgi:hypothetical protein